MKSEVDIQLYINYSIVVTGNYFLDCFQFNYSGYWVIADNYSIAVVSGTDTELARLFIILHITEFNKYQSSKKYI